MTGKVVIEHVGSLAHGANPAKYVMHATGLPASVCPQRVFSVIWQRPVLFACVVLRHGGIPSALSAPRPWCHGRGGRALATVPALWAPEESRFCPASSGYFNGSACSCFAAK
jgi:hypothetical protein